jgi:hypothetical protein
MSAGARAGLAAAIALAGLAAMPPALGQKPTRVYEPSSRLRTAIESCMKDEVMNGANCVKKCQPDFRLDLATRPPTCYALKPEAKYVPPKVEFSTPEKPVPHNAKGA